MNGHSMDVDFGYQLKPDVFDRTVLLREYFAHFNLIADANNWNGSMKAVALATNLRGKARSVLDGIEGNFNFQQIRSKLELRFGSQVLF